MIYTLPFLMRLNAFYNLAFSSEEKCNYVLTYRANPRHQHFHLPFQCRKQLQRKRSKIKISTTGRFPARVSFGNISENVIAGIGLVSAFYTLICRVVNLYVRTFGHKKLTESIRRRPQDVATGPKFRGMTSCFLERLGFV